MELNPIKQPIIALHGGVSSNESLLNFVNNVIKYMAPRGVNTCVIEVDYSFKMKCFPELCEGSIDPDVLAKACDDLRAAGVEPIPLFNTFGLEKP